MGTSADIDRDALRTKYCEERDKRLRTDGNERYVEVTGIFEHYVDDPYVEPTEREPLFDEVAYFQYIDRWRSSGEFEGLEFQP